MRDLWALIFFFFLIRGHPTVDWDDISSSPRTMIQITLDYPLLSSYRLHRGSLLLLFMLLSTLFLSTGRVRGPKQRQFILFVFLLEWWVRSGK